MFAAAALWGLDIVDDAPFFLTIAAIGLVGAFLVARFGTWAKVIGIVASVLMAMALFWTAFGLFTPMSFFDFVPGVLVIPGALIAIVGCIRAILAARRSDLTAAPEGAERRAIRVVLTIVLVLSVVSAGLTFTSRTSADEASAEQVVTLSDFEFESESYTFEAGSTVLVRNDDPFFHTFTIEALDIDIDVSPGSEELVDIPDEPGTFVVFCRPHTREPEAPEPEDMAAEVTIR
jgi:plastocyanin